METGCFPRGPCRDIINKVLSSYMSSVRKAVKIEP
jgi:hypothetical protein